MSLRGEEVTINVTVERTRTSAHKPSSYDDQVDLGIVRRAAAVLEEELATSPLQERAAVSTTREPFAEAWRPAALIPVLLALRQTLLQVFDQTQAVGDGAQSGDGQAPSVAPVSGTHPPVLQISQRACAGDVAELKLGMVNDSQTEAMDVELCWTDLIAGPTDRIAEKQIALQPPRLRLEPEQRTEIVVQVHLPADTPSGTYIGLVRAAGPADQTVVVTIYVV